MRPPNQRVTRNDLRRKSQTSDGAAPAAKRAANAYQLFAKERRRGQRRFWVINHDSGYNQQTWGDTVTYPWYCFLLQRCSFVVEAPPTSWMSHGHCEPNRVSMIDRAINTSSNNLMMFESLVPTES